MESFLDFHGFFPIFQVPEHSPSSGSSVSPPSGSPTNYQRQDLNDFGVNAFAAAFNNSFPPYPNFEGAAAASAASTMPSLSAFPSPPPTGSPPANLLTTVKHEPFNHGHAFNNSGNTSGEQDPFQGLNENCDWIQPSQETTEADN